jgi:hypothetical protein
MSFWKFNVLNINMNILDNKYKRNSEEQNPFKEYALI